MAKPYDDGMDLYDEPMHDQDPREAGSATPKDGDEDESEDARTALLPKSICEGMKPGEELVLRIDKVLDSEYQVSYAPKKKGDDGAQDNPLYD